MIKKKIKVILTNVIQLLFDNKLGSFTLNQFLPLFINRNITVIHNQFTFNFLTPNPITLWRVKTFSFKEPYTLAWIDKMETKSCFWDVGANVGLFSVYAAKTRQSNVYAFEPSVFNLELLVRNIYRNNVKKLVKLVPLALSSKDGFNDLLISDTQWGGALSSFGENFGSDGKIFLDNFQYRTMGVSANTFLNMKNIKQPDYIKIDVDGIEHLILEGADQVLKNVKSILVEINDDFEEQSKKSNQILKILGFQLIEKKLASSLKSKTPNVYNQIWYNSKFSFKKKRITNIKSNETCPNCNSSNIKFFSDYKGNSGIFLNKKLFACLECDLNFINPLPPSKDIVNYNKSYFLNAHNYNLESNEILLYNKAISKVRVNFVNRNIKDVKNKILNVLEIGPGYGHFLASWFKLFPYAKYYIDETDTNVKKYLIKKFNVTDIKDLNQKKLDLVIISHVLEHSLDPNEFIKSKTKFLKKGGIIFIDIPCQDNLYKKIFEPHTLFYNKKSLRFLLEGLNFKNIKITYHGEDHSSIIYKYNLNKIIFKITKFIKLPPKLLFSNRFSALDENLSIEERHSLILNVPSKQSENPSRWMRAIAEK